MISYAGKLTSTALIQRWLLPTYAVRHSRLLDTTSCSLRLAQSRTALTEQSKLLLIYLVFQDLSQKFSAPSCC